mmetsp:Transcript_1811/g.4625  ORF Transcript_1811/g.4625 Transcript_1811/m.4625 type:complete len:197 (+) Transcript_1811:212-802(+)
MQQIAGHSMKPKELSGLMKSATLGTPLESKTETHQIMSTELESGGSRAHVYSDPDLGASGRSTVVNSRHTSGTYSINFNLETLPPFYWFDTEAKSKEKERVDASWVFGLPRVKGYFGVDRKVTLHPAYTINNKGGCVDDDMLEWIDKIVTPAYPNVKPEWEYDLSGETFHKLDALPISDTYLDVGRVLVRPDATTL